MSHQRQWVVTFCYKMYEKLKSHSKILNPTDIDIYFRLGQSPEVST